MEQEKWKVSACEGGWDCVRDEHDVIICTLVLNEPANACLIAAAPDLLEACKFSLELIEAIEKANEKTIDAVMECYPMVRRPPKPPIKIIEKAITKAEGTKPPTEQT